MTYECSPRPTRDAERRVDQHVGARLRHGRKLLGLNQTQLAEVLGVSYQQVQKYETGVNRLGPGKLFRVGQLLRTTPDFFFAGLEIPRSSQLDGDYAELAARFRRAPAFVQQAIRTLLEAE